MSEPLILKVENAAADNFQAMADRIRHNADQKFGGAFVVVPPDGQGDTLEVLILDTKMEPAQFWSTLKTKCDMALSELDTRARTVGAYGRR